jgi:hypothetical protein
MQQAVFQQGIQLQDIQVIRASTYAVAGFSAQRITMSSGSTRVPGAISGTVTGTTSVEIANALGGPVAARAAGGPLDMLQQTLMQWLPHLTFQIHAATP